jgi:hypothetical protein
MTTRNSNSDPAPVSTTIKYPKVSSFIGVFSDWIDTNGGLLLSKAECQIRISPGSGMQKQEAVITIKHDKNEFETNWKYSKSTFPSRVKALAKAMQIKGIRGDFLTIQLVDLTIVRMI